METSVLLCGKSKRNIDKIIEIVSEHLISQGNYVFSFSGQDSTNLTPDFYTVLSVSENQISSLKPRVDVLASLDIESLDFYKKNLKREGTTINPNKFSGNISDLAIYILVQIFRSLDVKKDEVLKSIEKNFNSEKAELAGIFYENSDVGQEFYLKQQDNNVKHFDFFDAFVSSLKRSCVEVVFFSKTSKTEFSKKLIDSDLSIKKIKSENHSETIKKAIGAEFSGTNVLMEMPLGEIKNFSRELGFAIQRDIPLVVLSEIDSNIEFLKDIRKYFPLILFPANSLELLEKTNQAFFLAKKIRIPALILYSKDSMNSSFCFDYKELGFKKIEKQKEVLGNKIIQSFSKEISEQDFEKKVSKIEREIGGFANLEFIGDNDSKNLIVFTGDLKGVLMDSLNELKLSAKLLELVYLEPLSEKIKKYIGKDKNVLVVENQDKMFLSEVLKQRFSIEIQDKNILCPKEKWDREQLKEQLKKRLK